VELRVVCDLSPLKLESGSFVEESLRAYYSDVLYSLKTVAGDGYFHVLIEHESTLAGRLYGTPFPLVDVRVIPDEEIMNHRSMVALNLLQKHI